MVAVPERELVLVFGNQVAVTEAAVVPLTGNTLIQVESLTAAVHDPPLLSTPPRPRAAAVTPVSARVTVLPLPSPIPLRSRLDFGRCVPWHAHPIGPACPRLHFRSVLQHASGFFPTRPRGARAWASHDGDPCMQLPSARGCYQLAPQRTA